MPCPAPAVAGAEGGFPLDVECVAGDCLPDDCSVDDDCPFPEWQACEPVGGRNLCIYPCTADADCTLTYNMFGTTCIGTIDLSGGAFCSQYPEPNG